MAGVHAAPPDVVSEASVYRYDDTGHGEVRVPASWRVVVKGSDVWKARHRPFGLWLGERRA